MNQIQPIPGGLTIEQLTARINDRFRNLDEDLKVLVENPAVADQDLGTKRIINLADPKDDLDGVNLRTLKKFGPTARPPEEADVSGETEQAYTIVFTKDGLVGSDEFSPSFTVNSLRIGRPTVVSVTAEVAPTITPMKVNWEVRFPIPKAPDQDEEDLEAFDAPVSLLKTDLELGIGKFGAVFASNFTDDVLKPRGKAGPWPRRTKARMKIIIGANAEQVVGEIVMRREPT